MSAFRDQPESRPLQGLVKGAQIPDAKFDFDFLVRSGALEARRARQREQRTRDVVERALRRWVFSPSGPRGALEAAFADVASGKRSPYEAASGLVERIRGGDGA